MSLGALEAIGGPIISKVVGGVAGVVGRASVRAADESVGAQVSAGVGRGGTIKANAAKAAAFEEKVVQGAQKTQTGVVRQLTIKTKSGVKTKIDCAGCDAQTGAVRLTEAKSSATAPLTRNQRVAFPQIRRTGGTVVGKGKPGFPGGTRIPPTNVEIIRP